MERSSPISRLRNALFDELEQRMLPYWVENSVDEENGGFLGRIRRNGEPVRDAPKGSVLNSRILWTFAAAHRRLEDNRFRELAARARAYLVEQFWDPAHGGVFWSVDSRGQPLETRKQTYAQAFALYGLAEYHRATGNRDALDQAVRLFELVETRTMEPEHGGYLEALGQSWERIEDVRLSDKDLNAPKNMNTHLHVLEAYTNLFRTWPDPLLREKLASLIGLFLEKIIDTDKDHLHTFFDMDWTPVTDVISFGHDIEASWLLLEAVDVLGDTALRDEVRDAAVALATATLKEGIDPDGGMVNEARPDGDSDGDKYWWVQAEAIVGFVNAYQETRSPEFVEAAVAIWEYARRYLADDDFGEWHFRVAQDGRPYPDDDKVGMWKCPYHGARACFEVIERAARMEQVRT
ncbi:MAG: AGE family epimerase/isomerase [Gemmatimonadota bacterium]|nr:MAG: AGE family epimerase/isomerase [Gemmatimonadota bacterium]